MYAITRTTTTTKYCLLCNRPTTFSSICLNRIRIKVYDYFFLMCMPSQTDSYITKEFNAHSIIAQVSGVVLVMSMLAISDI